MRDRDHRDREVRREFRREARRINANVPVGFILLLIGGAYLARQMGVDFPSWFFSWEILLILIGIIVGFTTKFRDFSWLILIGIGLVFLADDLYPIKNYIWPALIILVGLIIILKPSRLVKTPEPAADANPQVINIDLEASDDYVKIHAKDGAFIKNRTMGNFENLLDPQQFVRCHRSYMVNVQFITRIDPFEKESFLAILKTGAKVPVSKTGYAKLKKVLGL